MLLKTLKELLYWRNKFQGRLVVTNGVFDLLHVGHVKLLEEARSLGDGLLVGLNSDSSVRMLKGKGRPLNAESDRAIILTSLRAVDAVFIFPEVSALDFLTIIKPDIWVKGSDYTLDTLNQHERAAIEKAGEIVIIPFVSGKSTSTLIKKLREI